MGESNTPSLRHSTTPFFCARPRRALRKSQPRFRSFVFAVDNAKTVVISDEGEIFFLA